MIMDYEKKYKEALQRMKSWARGEHPECFSEAQKAAEFVFPELAESEDEKIRKGLIENFKWFCGDFPETTKWGKDDDMLVKDIISWLEKQIKQNPAEWSEDDEKHCQGCLNLIRLSLDTKPYPYYNDYLWLKSLKERVQPQSKLDEKDKKKPYVVSTNRELLSLQHETIGWLEDHKQFAAKDDIQYIQDCIEKIRTIQLPQWSEEDETLINRIEGWLETLCDYLNDSSYECIEDVKDIIEKLKSIKLQNHWKPSDEQMEALSSTMGDSTSTHYSATLHSLYNDLKKLKGE